MSETFASKWKWGTESRPLLYAAPVAWYITHRRHQLPSEVNLFVGSQNSEPVYTKPASVTPLNLLQL